MSTDILSGRLILREHELLSLRHSEKEEEIMGHLKRKMLHDMVDKILEDGKVHFTETNSMYPPHTREIIARVAILTVEEYKRLKQIEQDYEFYIAQRYKPKNDKKDSFKFL